MRTAFVASLIGNVVLLIGAGLGWMQSQKLDMASHEAAKWKQAAIKSYRLRVISEDASAEIIGSYATRLQSICSSGQYMMAQMMLSTRISMGLRNIVNQVNTKLNAGDGDLKEPLDDAIWQEK